MPFQLPSIGNLALAEANLTFDVEHYAPRSLVSALELLKGKGNGSITLRNASLLSSSDLVSIAKVLGARLTLED